MGLKNKASKIGAIILILLMCVSLLIVPEFVQAADSNDKTDLISPTLTGTVSQNDEKVTDTIDPDKSFDVKISFKFPIIRDEMIGTPLAGGIKDKSQQVDDGDYAYFTLGKNFKAVEASGNSIPVYIQAPGNPDDGKQVGTITLSQEGSGEVKAKMYFHDPNGAFQYESEGRKDLTVHFTGHFQAENQSSHTPGSDERFIKVLDKEYPFPAVEEKNTYEFTKAGQLADPEKKDSINWTVNIRKTSNKGSVSLGGETFFDDLSEVGTYAEGTFKVNDNKVDDTGIYDGQNGTLTYVFSDDFEGNTAKISFSTAVANPDSTQSVTNEAKLKVPNEDEKTAKAEVTVHPPLDIKKNLQKININDDGEWEVIWTIIAGAPYEDYGPAWVGDILSGKLEGQAPPKKVDLTYSHSMTGKDKSWKDVAKDNIGKLSPEDAKDFPKFPEGEDAACPDFPGYDKEVYELGTGWHEPTKPASEDDEYKPIQNNWCFFKDLNGLYRITVKLVYDEGTEIGPLKNDAEIHTCADTVYPIKPPVYSGIAAITKNAKEDYDYRTLNQGILPWSVEVDFTNVFPSDDRFVYECFYYGKESEFDNEKGDLTAKGKVPEDVLDKMVKGEDKETYFNFDQAYLEGSLGYKASENQDDKLTDEIIPLFNAKDERVGEVVKISGFSEIKKYEFTLKTRAQDIIKKLENSTSGSYSFIYKNTAILAVGSGDTLKTLKAADKYELPGNLLGKFAMECDADLGDMGDVSKNNFKSSLRDYITVIPQVDDSKTFNYKDRSIFFRIDVNPQGLKLKDYISKLSGAKPEGDFTKLEVRDTLQDGLNLRPVEDGGPDYYIYQAEPGQAAFIKRGGVVIPGSAPFVSFMPPGKSVKKLTPEEAKVSFDKDKMTWTFDQYDGTPYFIVIRTEVSEELFNELIKNKAQGEKINFKNHVDLTAGGKNLAATDGSASLTKYMLTKENPEVIGERLKWSFEYKPFGLELSDVVIKDVLDRNIGIPIDEKGKPLLDNFSIMRSNKLEGDGTYKDFTDVRVVTGTPKAGEVSIRYDLEEHSIYFSLPDPKEGEDAYAYRFTYSTILKPVDLKADVIKNHIEMSAKNEKPGASGNSEIKTQDYAAFANITAYPYFVIKKVDQEGNPLAGAIFQYTDNTGEKINCLSGKDGMVYIIKLPDGISEVKETKAPYGYMKLAEPIKLEAVAEGVALISSPDESEGEGSFTNPLLVKNREIEKTSIDVIKHWQGDKPSDRPDAIRVILVQNGQAMDNTLTVSKENGWRGSFKDIPKLDEDGKPIIYTVIESPVEGYKSAVSGDSEGGFIITNTKPEEPVEPGKPDKAENPDKPNKPGNSDGHGKADVPDKPDTGDTGSIYSWAGLAMISALCLLLILRSRKIHRQGCQKKACK